MRQRVCDNEHEMTGGVWHEHPRIWQSARSIEPIDRTDDRRVDGSRRRRGRAAAARLDLPEKGLRTMRAGPEPPGAASRCCHPPFDPETGECEPREVACDPDATPPGPTPPPCFTDCAPTDGLRHELLCAGASLLSRRGPLLSPGCALLQ
jgi:hypothetical protein